MKVNSQHKFERNIQIFDDYVNSNYSYKNLAKKYHLTSQRIQKIVKTLKEQNIKIGLSIKVSKKERERYKNFAVELRESGKLLLSRRMLEEVIAWDDANKNYRGKSDVLGHLKIVIDKQANYAKSTKEKLKFYDESKKALDRSLLLINKGMVKKKGARNITLTHIASLQLKRANLLKNNARKKGVKSALITINKALNGFSGSKAAVAWPLNVKAKILIALEKYDQAFKILQLAEKNIYDGYIDEMKGFSDKGAVADQGKLKLKIWHCAVWTSYGQLFKDSGREVLAEQYFNGVIQAPDVSGYLMEVKAKAKKLVKS